MRPAGIERSFKEMQAQVVTIADDLLVHQKPRHVIRVDWRTHLTAIDHEPVSISAARERRALITRVARVGITEQRDIALQLPRDDVLRDRELACDLVVIETVE